MKSGGSPGRPTACDHEPLERDAFARRKLELAVPERSHGGLQIAIAVVLGVEGGLLDERAVRVDLAAQVSLGERRPVVRECRVRGQQPDGVGPARLAIGRHHAGRGEPAADDDERSAVAHGSTL